MLEYELPLIQYVWELRFGCNYSYIRRGEPVELDEYPTPDTNYTPSQNLALLAYKGIIFIVNVMKLNVTLMEIDTH